MASRRSFTVKEKVDIIKRLENGENNADLSKEIRVPHSTISSWWKNREAIQECYNLQSLNIKRNRKSHYQDIENALLVWIKLQRNPNAVLTTRNLIEKALYFAKKFENKKFKCTDGWINRFKQRNRIVVGKNGEVSVLPKSRILAPMQKDLTNYMEYKMGFTKIMRFTHDAVPSKSLSKDSSSECEEDLENYSSWKHGSKPRLKINATPKNLSKQPVTAGNNLEKARVASQPSTSNAINIADTKIAENIKKDCYKSRTGEVVLNPTANLIITRTVKDKLDDSSASLTECSSYIPSSEYSPKQTVHKKLFRVSAEKQADWRRAIELDHYYICGSDRNIKEDCYKIKSGRLRLKITANLILTKTFHELIEEDCFRCKSGRLRLKCTANLILQTRTDYESIEIQNENREETIELQPSTSTENHGDDIAKRKKKLQEAVPRGGRKDPRLDSQPHISTSTASQFESDPEPFNQEDQDTTQEDINILKSEFNQDEENIIHENNDTSQDTINIFKTCCFCNTQGEDCIEITDSKPYVSSNRTKVIFNDMSIEINKDTLKLVCQNCDSKLVEMYKFVKLVSEAQNRLTNVDLNTNLETNNEEATSSYSDDDSDDDTVSLSNSTVEDESICDTESVKETIGLKRIGENEDLIVIKKCRNNDYNNDPLSFNDEFKCKEEVDDKELVKDAILTNKVTGFKDSGENTEVTVKKEFNDEEQLNERKHIDKDILVIDIKEESNETGDENDYTEIPHHEKAIEVELTELYQDEEFS